MQTLFTDLFNYNEDANNKIIATLIVVDTINARAIEILSHLLNAHQIWLMRIQGANEGMPGVWQQRDKNCFFGLNKKVHDDTRLCLQSDQFGADLHKVVHYINSKGDKFRNTIQEIYLQVLTHSAYHRGQIALMLRQENINPPLTDYIIYKRDK